MAKKIDRTQPEIVRALRKAGCFVQSLADLGKGVPDILVCTRGKTFLLEIKDAMQPPSKQRLTPLEADWHKLALCAGVKVHVVRSPQEALQAVGLIQVEGR